MKTVSLSESKKALLVAGVIVLGASAAIAALVIASGTPAPRAAGVAQVPGPAPAAQPRPPGTGEAPDDRLLQRRLRFAAELERRYRSKGLAIALEVVGDRQRVLRLRWTLQAAKDHVEQLKGAELLWREVQDLGFRRAEMVERSSDAPLWARDFP